MTNFRLADKEDQLIPQSEEYPDIFEELPNQIFIIAQKINLLVLEKEAGIDGLILGVWFP